MVRQPVSQTGNLSSILSDTTYYRVCSTVVNVPDCQSGDWGSIPPHPANGEVTQWDWDLS